MHATLVIHVICAIQTVSFSTGSIRNTFLHAVVDMQAIHPIHATHMLNMLDLLDILYVLYIFYMLPKQHNAICVFSAVHAG